MRRALAIAAILTCLVAAPAQARVVRVIIDHRELLLGGQSFGRAGAYERIEGRIYLALDPTNPHDRAIVDLDLAPRNARGEVEAWATFVALRPRDATRSNGALWLEISNRGGKSSLRLFDLASESTTDFSTPEQLGDALLLREGLTIVWVGWQWDVPGDSTVLRLHAPIATDHGRTLEGLVRADWTIDEPTTLVTLGHRNHRAYEPIDPNDSAIALTVRSGELGERTVVPRARWRIAEDRQHLEMAGGFTPGRIYELVYRARDPVVVGIGLAMIRDVASYAKYDPASEFPARVTIAYGVSQTGRLLRHMLYQGFDTDESGRRAIDGMFIYTAGGGRGSFNHRFAQPSHDAQPSSSYWYPTDLFPFTSRVERDPLTGVEDGLLAHLAGAPPPRIFYVNGGYEYYGRAGSLVHTTPDGLRDVAPMPNERLYVISGAQHSGPARAPLPDAAHVEGTPVWRGDPLDQRYIVRALAVDLVHWVRDGVAPPASRYPRIADGTLVPLDSVRFPRVPGVTLPTIIHLARREDFGPRWSQGIIDIEPPKIGALYPARVSQVDSLGNEVGGIRAPELVVPLATYTPWQLRTGYAGMTDQLVDFAGTFIPLPRTRAERARTGDPRPSLETVYGSEAELARRTEGAARVLVRERFMLADDVSRVVSEAEGQWRWVMSRAER